MKRSLALIATLAVSGAVAVPALAATKRIKIGDNYFVKKGTQPKITLKRGTKVTWTWPNTGVPHNVTVISGPVTFRSPTKTKGTYSKRMTRKGTYQISCTIHSGMNMTLKVR
jgi:plastocyanin